MRGALLFCLALALLACSSQSEGSPATTSASATRSTCHAADLLLSVGAAGAWHTYATQELTLENRGASGCSFDGPPAMTLQLEGQVEAVVSPDTYATTHVNIGPGQSLIILVGTPGACMGGGQPVVGTRILVRLHPDETLTANGVWVNVACGPPRVVQFDANG